MIAIGDDAYPSLPISTLGTEGRSAVVLDEVFRQFRKRKKITEDRIAIPFLFVQCRGKQNKKVK